MRGGGRGRRGGAGFGARAAAAAAAAAKEAGADGTPPTGADPGPPAFDYVTLLRELADEQSYPRLHQFAWAPQREVQRPPSETEAFVSGLDIILDGIQALIDRGRSESGSPAATGG